MRRRQGLPRCRDCNRCSIKEGVRCKLLSDQEYKRAEEEAEEERRLAWMAKLKEHPSRLAGLLKFVATQIQDKTKLPEIIKRYIPRPSASPQEDDPFEAILRSIHEFIAQDSYSHPIAMFSPEGKLYEGKRFDDFLFSDDESIAYKLICLESPSLSR